MMTPLFADTQSLSSQSLQSDIHNLSLNSGITSQSIQVQATQDVQQFSATQTDKAKGPYNWLTKPVDDSLAETGFVIGSLSESLQSLSSSLFMFNPTRNVSTSSKSSKSTEINQNNEKSVSAKSGSQTLALLRRRFLRSDEATSLYHAKRVLRQQKLEEKQDKLQELRRHSQVTMYRSYRIGDLPDVEIPSSAIIKPLQALAEKDDFVARKLFTSLFKGIIAELEENGDSNSKNVLETYLKNISMIFEKTSYYNPTFIASVMVKHTFEQAHKITIVCLFKTAKAQLPRCNSNILYYHKKGKVTKINKGLFSLTLNVDTSTCSCSICIVLVVMESAEERTVIEKMPANAS
ncbi:DNA-dependent protein kinase catalytic subunit [Nymphon striatum]|nr:DNA-dependent protein kinase catalytic subunit [Nymphon striatum]